MAAGDKAAWSDLQLARPRFNGTFAGSIANNTSVSMAPTPNVTQGGITVVTSVITVPTAGEYEIGIMLRWASQATAAGIRVGRFNVNGVDAGFFNIPTTTALNATNISVGGVSRLMLNAADQIVFQAFQNSGGALALAGNSHAWVDRVPQ